MDDAIQKHSAEVLREIIRNTVLARRLIAILEGTPNINAFAALSGAMGVVIQTFEPEKRKQVFELFQRLLRDQAFGQESHKIIDFLAPTRADAPKIVDPRS